MRLFRRAAGAGDRWLIAGLGNPGRDYARSRHNAGAMALDELGERLGATFKRHKSGCFVAEGDVAGERVVLARPISYMNESGRPLRALASYYKIDAGRFVVLHDEIDLPFGEVRIKFGGGTAGHNGLKSLVSHLGTKDFARVRIGVSRPRGDHGATGHVLGDFSAREREELPALLGRAADAAQRIVETGVEGAMNEVNTRR
ncbi:MAG: aminoacyl-tRNA hydrolase [Actinomycetota bacterium]